MHLWKQNIPFEFFLLILKENSIISIFYLNIESYASIIIIFKLTEVHTFYTNIFI